MASLKGSQTEKNLLAAFAGESQARNRYAYFSSVAKKEGYEQIAALFMETADNEVSHAKQFFKFLEGGEVSITAAYPAGVIGTTAECLKAAADGERHEHTRLYPDAADVADQEGFKSVALCFRLISKVEVQHELRYRKLLDNLEKGLVFKKTVPVKWKCRKCGYVHEGLEALEKCPACQHPKAYFEIKEENY